MFFYVFSTELLMSHCKNTESESLDPSIDFFAWSYIVRHRYASKKVHFTCFSTILALSLSSPCRTQLLPSSDFLAYVYSGNLMSQSICISGDRCQNSDLAIWDLVTNLYLVAWSSDQRCHLIRGRKRERDSDFHSHFTRYVVPYTWHLVPFTLYLAPYTVYSAPCTLYPVPWT